MGSTKRFVALAGVACAALVAPARAQQPAAAPTAAAGEAPTREQCLEAHELGQSARLNGHLVTARRALRQCTATGCPALVSRDCASWLADVEQQLPSVIFRAVKDGSDVETLRVREGEQVLTESLTGRALELDPGPHHFTAELSGFPAQHATYVLQAGDKSRVVLFRFDTPPPAAPAPPSATPAPAPVADSAPTERPIPTLSYAFGGVALAALVAGGVLGGMAVAERDELSGRCEPLCRERDLASVKGLALGADISLLVAVVSAGTAGYLYATRPSVQLQTSSSGWQLGVGGRF